MEKIKMWLKEQSQKPRFFAKVLALVLIIIALLIPKNQDNSGKQDGSASSTYTQQGASDEDEEEDAAKYEFHIGTSNLIALAGGIIALAIVKNKEKSFLNKHNKK